MNKYSEYFRHKAKTLQSKYESIGNVSHHGTKGSAREIFLTEYLKNIYPERYVVGDGEIIDSEGGISNQADIVIYDDHLPVLEYGSTKHFLSEGALAHIEVKSNLSGNLENSLNKTKSVKNLDQKIDPALTIGDIAPNIFSTVFAYEGPTKDTIKSNFIEYYSDEKINEKADWMDIDKVQKSADIICVNNKYIMVKIDPRAMGFSFSGLSDFNNSIQDTPFLVFPNEDGESSSVIMFVETGENSLMMYSNFLFRAVYKNWMGQPNLTKYMDFDSKNLF